MIFSIGNPLHKKKMEITSNAFSSYRHLKIFYFCLNFSGFWFDSLTVNSDHGGLKELLIRTQKYVIQKHFSQTIEERGIIKRYTEISRARRYKLNPFL